MFKLFRLFIEHRYHHTRIMVASCRHCNPPSGNYRYIGEQGECDWCGKKFVLAKNNMIGPDGQWLLDQCNECQSR